ncbi:hypothetical protein PCASD_12314 [Puccinia coronata f. sp. avenae]|uniref:Uncharacterized protein n=1 Tax=Puccinia coronata f. sp. avenae TaxID=200324 RepID=A0A2N5TCV4_9BASI|nr:hypothetical protein PCASD_12314 [Puccinia coronata f. sp. avenae]
MCSFLNDSECSTKPAVIRDQISWLADDFGILIDHQVIKWSKSSDLAILQEEWQEPLRKSNGTLSEMLTGAYARRKRFERNEETDDEEEEKAHETIAKQLTQFAMPILPFTLDPEISSDELDSLWQSTFALHIMITHLAGCLCSIYATADNISTKLRKLGENIALFISSH